MKTVRSITGSIIGLCVINLCACSQVKSTPSVTIRQAPTIKLPGALFHSKKTYGCTDCNNPAHWDGDIMYLFSSCGHPYRTNGPDLNNLAPVPKRIIFHDKKKWTGGPRWFEATYKDANGKLYAWYHNEPPHICKNKRLTAPRIGAIVSQDNGLNCKDLGFILEAPKDSLNCTTTNVYFAGGNGDFSVILDNQKKYFYFFISTYNKDIKEQGVAVARMPYEDRENPNGKVWKWYNGQWKQPGLGGHVTPIFPAENDWHRPNVRAFWGPSIHWNTYLKQYVILLNLAKDPKWGQEGIYISFNPNLADPRGWSTPKKIYQGGPWYPQVVGSDPGKGQTDKLAGRIARLFLRGKSNWEIVFQKHPETN